MANERRIFERLPCNFAIEVRNPFTYSFERVKSCDFSAGGLGIISRRSLPLGEDVELKIQVSKRHSPIPHRARVVWSRQEASGWWRIGLRFPPFKLFKLMPVGEGFYPL